MLLCTSLAFAQSVKVTGTVTDKMGAVIGATIMVKNSSNGTVTDIDGRYSIEVPKNATLLFSFVGYSTVEKEVGNNTVINVELSDDIQAIDEVVVNRYQAAKEEDRLHNPTNQQ